MKEKNKVASESAEEVVETDTAKIIADLEAKVKENLDLAKYQKAEFENFKRRNQNAVTAAFQDGSCGGGTYFRREPEGCQCDLLAYHRPRQYVHHGENSLHR